MQGHNIHSPIGIRLIADLIEQWLMGPLAQRRGLLWSKIGGVAIFSRCVDPLIPKGSRENLRPKFHLVRRPRNRLARQVVGSRPTSKRLLTRMV
jgi:hypothetical protein